MLFTCLKQCVQVGTMIHVIFLLSLLSYDWKEFFNDFEKNESTNNEWKKPIEILKTRSMYDIYSLGVMSKCAKTIINESKSVNDMLNMLVLDDKVLVYTKDIEKNYILSTCIMNTTHMSYENEESFFQRILGMYSLVRHKCIYSIEKACDGISLQIGRHSIENKNL